MLEKIPAALGKRVTEELKIPMIGIGAGRFVDGQVLVAHDMLGLNRQFSPRFLRRYANLYDAMQEAFRHYVKDVKTGCFPDDKEQY